MGRQREGEVLSMGSLVEQLCRQKCVEEQLIMLSSGEQLFRQRRVGKTADSVELWRTAVQAETR